MVNKLIVIIGGMGPYASAYFYELLLKKSNDLYGAKNNDDYPEILIDSVPVPDFISDTTKLEDAKKMLVSRISKLNIYSYSTLAMVCNTGHILYPELLKYSKNNFISMVNIVSEEAHRRKMKKVGILATPMTVRSAIYNRALSKFGIEVVYPMLKVQKEHEIIVRGVLRGRRADLHVQKLCKFTRELMKKNELDGVILGCTELPLVFPKTKFKKEEIIDCLDVLANRLLIRYYGKEGERK